MNVFEVLALAAAAIMVGAFGWLNFIFIKLWFRHARAHGVNPWIGLGLRVIDYQRWNGIYVTMIRDFRAYYSDSFLKRFAVYVILMPILLIVTFAFLAIV